MPRRSRTKQQRRPTRTRGKTPLNRWDIPVVIRVSDEDNALIPHVEVARAIGFVKAKARQLTKLLWRDSSQSSARNNLPNRTYYWAMPGSEIAIIELKTNPREQSWHARIIGGSLPAGILALPRNVDDPDGWVRPFEDPDAVPPVELPGTPFQDATPAPPPLNNRGIFRRKGGKVTYIRDQDFRLFESEALVDWRSFQIKNESLPGGEDFEILHWHAASRYLPRYNSPPIGATDISTAVFENFFYDRSGTVKVFGPTPNGATTDDIRGVAIRNLDDDEKETEYLCIIGFHEMAGGYEVHAMSRADPEILTGDPAAWRFLGSVGPFPELGTGLVVNGLKWDVPLNFNRVGTKACQINMTKSDAAEGASRPYLLEISVSGESVTATNVNVTTPSNTVAVRRNPGGILNIVAGDISLLPTCDPGDPSAVGSITNSDTTTFDTENSGETTQDDCPLAADYKIDTDNEIGFITTSSQSIGSSSTEGVTVLSTTFNEVCKIPVGGGFTLGSHITPGVIVPFPTTPTVSTGSRNFVYKDYSDNKMTIKIDGGFHQATVGPLSVGVAQGNENTTILDTGSAPQVVSITQDTPQDELQIGAPDNFFTTEIEIKWADIRYGSMIIKHRVFQPEEGFFFNQPGTDAPTVANPQTVGPVINQRLGVDLLPVIAIAGTSLPVDLGEVASWAPRNRFLNKTIVVAQDVSEQFEDVDEFYAQNFTTGLFQIPRIFTRGLQSAADSVALGTDIDESTSEANAPNYRSERLIISSPLR